MGALIVQSDNTVLLETGHPDARKARDQIVSFCDLLKSPDFMHTYRISRLSLWNAASLGWTSEQILSVLTRHCRFPIPESVQLYLWQEMAKYGCLELIVARNVGHIELTGDPKVLAELIGHPEVRKLQSNRSSKQLLFATSARGELKRCLTKIGYPIIDRIGYEEGASLPVHLKVPLRAYQQEAVDAFFHQGEDVGAGVIVLPCGAGKTVVGMAAIAQTSNHTLVLTPNTTAAKQWKRELLAKSSLDETQVGEYSKDVKELKPVTITTYQMMTYKSNGIYPHFEKLARQNWGLIIYDEVHLLPAPAFRLTAELQSTRRLGLTATLVREDGMEGEVFSLIGPKKYDLPWKEVEEQGWISETTCYEVTVEMDSSTRYRYLSAPERQKYRVAAENPRKEAVIRALLKRHHNDNILIIGQYVEQLTQLAKTISAPLITGKTPNLERECLYQKFRSGEIRLLIVSKVANVAIDLPAANVAIQVSGSYGSRQEEAQRVGRLLRPNQNGDGSHFYTVVSADSKERERSANRQLFLTEQGYEYVCLSEEEIFH